MLVGTSKFICDECGEQFHGLAFEYRATCYLAPLHCPKCGSWHTMPYVSGISRWLGLGSSKTIYRLIWADLDKQQPGPTSLHPKK